MPLSAETVEVFEERMFAMKKVVCIVCVLMLFSITMPISSCADSWDELVQQKAEEIVNESFNADYGVMDYYEQCLNEYGIFRYWSVEQKYWVCSLLPYLIDAEKDRLQQFHPDWIPSDLLEKTILQWNYGQVKPGMVSENEAVNTAVNFMTAEYGVDCSAWKVSMSLYTGHWTKEFISPYWVIRFYDKAVLKAEVWINACTSHMPTHQMLDVQKLAKMQFTKALQEGYIVAGQTVTEDMITDEQEMTFYNEEENNWITIIRIEDSYWEISIDDETLKIVETDTSNG